MPRSILRRLLMLPTLQADLVLWRRPALDAVRRSGWYDLAAISVAN